MAYTSLPQTRTLSNMTSPLPPEVVENILQQTLKIQVEEEIETYIEEQVQKLRNDELWLMIQHDQSGRLHTDGAFEKAAAELDLQETERLPHLFQNIKAAAAADSQMLKWPVRKVLRSLVARHESCEAKCAHEKAIFEADVRKMRLLPLAANFKTVSQARRDAKDVFDCKNEAEMDRCEWLQFMLIRLYEELFGEVDEPEVEFGISLISLDDEIHERMVAILEEHET